MLQGDILDPSSDDESFCYSNMEELSQLYSCSAEFYLLEQFRYHDDFIAKRVEWLVKRIFKEYDVDFKEIQSNNEYNRRFKSLAKCLTEIFSESGESNV